MPNDKSPEKKPLPDLIIDFATAFMLALNAARLYASNHDIFKRHTQQLKLEKSVIQGVGLATLLYSQLGGSPNRDILSPNSL